MPDFSEILKIAVEQQDWQLICGLYTNITGEPLSVTQAIVEEEEKEEEDVLSKDYSIEELKYQNQLAPQEQDMELVDKDIDKLIESGYNDFIAPSRSDSRGVAEGRRMRAEPIGKRPLRSGYVGVNQEPFVDDMTEALVDPETGESLVGQNKNAQMTPRNRRKELGMNDTSLVEVVCSSCESKMSVSPILSRGFSNNPSDNEWKCNNCSTRKGRVDARRNS